MIRLKFDVINEGQIIHTFRYHYRYQKYRQKTRRPLAKLDSSLPTIGKIYSSDMITMTNNVAINQKDKKKKS